MNYIINKMTNKEIQHRLNALPVIWSRISILVTGNDGLIRGKGKYGIPNKYRNQLIELIRILELWQNDL